MATSARSGGTRPPTGFRLPHQPPTAQSIARLRDVSPMSSSSQNIPTTKPCSAPHGRFDLSELRAKLAQTKGPVYWRSLEELAGTREFNEMLQREFAPGASEWL